MITYKNSEIQSIICSKNQFLITWHMTGWCNYSCPYCIAKSFQTSWIAEEKIIEIADNLNSFINEYKQKERVCLRAVGGEITYYDLPKIFDHIEHLDKVNIATNFSRDIHYYKDLIKYFKDRGTQLILCCSFHEENKDFKNKFIQLTKWCRENAYKDPHAMIVVLNNFKFSDLNPYLKEDVWKIRLSRCRNNNTMANEPLDEEILKVIQEYNYYYDKRVNEGLKNKAQCWNVTFKDGSIIHLGSASDLTNHLDYDGFIPDNYYCTAGINSLCILPNGDLILSRCDYLKNNIIGNIFNRDKIKLPTKPILCELNKKTAGEKRCDLCSGANLIRRDI